MPQGIVGTGGAGRLNVSVPGFSMGPDVQVNAGPDYTGQIDQLIRQERAYMPRLKQWAMSQNQPAPRRAAPEPIAPQYDRVGGFGKTDMSVADQLAIKQYEDQKKADFEQKDFMMRHQFMPKSISNIGGSSPGTYITDDPSKLPLQLRAMFGPQDTKVGYMPTLTGASLDPSMPAGGRGSLFPSKAARAMGQDRGAINPSAQMRLGDAYDKRYGVGAYTPEPE
jgi:hypothetical protein